MRSIASLTNALSALWSLQCVSSVRDSTLERSGKTEAYFVQSELAKVFEDNISAFLNPGITPGAHVMHLSAPKAEVIIRHLLAF